MYDFVPLLSSIILHTKAYRNAALLYAVKGKFSAQVPNFAIIAT